MPDSLTVMIAATGGVWETRAERAVQSIRRWAPDVRSLIWRYQRGRTPGDVARFGGLLECDTPWILHLDADSLATGDVRPLARALADSGRQFLGRRSPIHAHPKWRQDRYKEMLRTAGLPYRSGPWGHFLLSRDLARQITPRFRYWMQWFLRYRPLVFERGHNKCHHELCLTLALAEAGILDADTLWLGPGTFSSHSRDELGIIHHFNGHTYVQLEREGRLQVAIKERRHG